ncbi:hypothetical protein DPMN_134538 [Dreissena polymorpha]|uniref:Uncharacterized protein n=1 Tax=Dreissena polymorpha TaxID=45954 RepID=A0A9D4FZ49_DREPO|nr:hypothetical protein DPMN_134538 [Dreissena polymorpha]
MDRPGGYKLAPNVGPSNEGSDIPDRVRTPESSSDEDRLRYTRMDRKTDSSCCRHLRLKQDQGRTHEGHPRKQGLVNSID